MSSTPAPSHQPSRRGFVPKDAFPRLRRSWATLLSLAGVAALLLLLLLHELGLALLLLLAWYIAMSGCDWGLHKLVLHNDASVIRAWRDAHRVHHREYDGATLFKTGASLTFPHVSCAGIALGTMPIALVLGALWVEQPRQLLGVALAHIVAIFGAVGVHNAAHSTFHDYALPSWRYAPCVPMPRRFTQLLHDHHECHHINAKVNLCTVLLGFDWIAGTTYTPADDAEFECDDFVPPLPPKSQLGGKAGRTVCLPGLL